MAESSSKGRFILCGSRIHWDTLPLWQPAQPQPSAQHPTLRGLSSRKAKHLQSHLTSSRVYELGHSPGQPVALWFFVWFFFLSPFGFISACSGKIQPRDPCTTFPQLETQVTQLKDAWRYYEHSSWIGSMLVQGHKEAGACGWEQGQGRGGGQERNTAALSNLPYVTVKTPPESAEISPCPSAPGRARAWEQCCRNIWGQHGLTVSDFAISWMEKRLAVPCLVQYKQQKPSN